MKHKLPLSRRGRIIAIIASIGVALLVVGIVLAASVTIDNFTVADQAATVVASPAIKSACDSTSIATSALGGTREVTITKYNGTGGSSSAAMIADTTTTPPKLSFATASGIGATGEAIWDGVSNACTLDTQGLGGVDLTGGGTNDGILARVTFDDISPVTMTLRVYTGTNWSDSYVILPGNILFGSKVDFFLPFSGFTTRGGTGAVFNSTGAVVVALDNRGAGAGADVDITLVQATSINDYGDLPNTYSTTLASNGPRHLTSTGLRLGNNVDAETDGAPTVDATGDNTAGTPDDEDGVARIFTEKWVPDATVHLTITVNGCTGTCRLNSWMDWNNNGVFAAAGEQVYTDTAVTDGSGQSFALTIPSSYITGTSISARFRLCSGTGQCDTYFGSAPNGEVEDYRWGFRPTAITLSSLSAKSETESSTSLIFLTVAVLGLGTLGFITIRRRRTHSL